MNQNAGTTTWRPIMDILITENNENSNIYRQFNKYTKITTPTKTIMLNTRNRDDFTYLISFRRLGAVKIPFPGYYFEDFK